MHRLCEYGSLLQHFKILTIVQFQPNPLDFGSDIFDTVLGDAFLRNVYAYVNYGDFEDENATSTKAPYIQLLNVSVKYFSPCGR